MSIQSLKKQIYWSMAMLAVFFLGAIFFDAIIHEDYSNYIEHRDYDEKVMRKYVDESIINLEIKIINSDYVYRNEIMDSAFVNRRT